MWSHYLQPLYPFRRHCTYHFKRMMVVRTGCMPWSLTRLTREAYQCGCQLSASLHQKNLKTPATVESDSMNRKRARLEGGFKPTAPSDELKSCSRRILAKDKLWVGFQTLRLQDSSVSKSSRLKSNHWTEENRIYWKSFDSFKIGDCG